MSRQAEFAAIAPALPASAKATAQQQAAAAVAIQGQNVLDSITPMEKALFAAYLMNVVFPMFTVQRSHRGIGKHLASF